MVLKSLSSRAIIGEFVRQIESGQSESFINEISYYNPSSSQFKEEYRWVGDIPSFTEWVGSRKVKELNDYKLIIENVKYELTMSVYADELKYDKTGQVQTRLDGIGAQSGDHWAELATSLIIAGESSVCYDGQFFFDTDHTEGNSGTQSNSITITIANLPIGSDYRGTTTDPSAETLARAVLKAIQQMYTFKSDRGKPINQGAKKFTVMIPVSFMGAAMLAQSSQFLGNNVLNPLKASDFQIKFEVNPRLTWTTKFAVFRTDGIGGTAPIIRQNMEDISYTNLDEKSDLYHNEDRMEFGAKSWRGIGYGLWQHACLGTLA